MNILLVGDFPNDPRLGSAKVPLKLAEEFRRLGHRCDLLFAEDLGRRPTGRLRQLVAPVLAARAVRAAVRRHGPYDVIDAASAEGLWVRAAGAAGGRRPAVVARSHGVEHLNYARLLADHAAGLIRKPWWKRVWYPAVRLPQVEWAARRADRVLLLNPTDRGFAAARRWRPADRLHVVGHGVSDRFLADAPPADAARGGGLLFCGTWTEMKGIDYLIDGYTRLAAGGRPPPLTILGGAAPEAVIRERFPPAARPHLRVLDRLPEDDVMAAYRAHDVLLFPSSYEGYGMVLLEAMTQRLPVVATPVGAAAELVRDGDTGLLVPVRRGDLLAAAAARLMADPPLRRRLADRAFDVTRGRTWAAAAAATLAVYEQAVRDAAGGPRGGR